MLKTDDLNYDLPSELIATEPAAHRDEARLLVTSRNDPDRIEHRLVRDLPDLLRDGDALIYNTTRVLPARFVGRRDDTGGQVQGLYVGPGPGPATWRVMLKARRFKPDMPIRLDLPSGEPSDIILRLVDRTADTTSPGTPEDTGLWIVSVDAPDPDAALDQIGLTPLPPYILSARKDAHLTSDERTDRDRYQTVFADQPGSVAAPTAGLHFTPDLISLLEAQGISHAGVVLHVGLGTFKPVETEFVEHHPIHSERCFIPAATLNLAHAARPRTIAVGTTTARALEGYYTEHATPDTWFNTDIMILPGHEWLALDGLMTNFHLPRSTLMAMVAALLPHGIEQLKRLYAIAIEERYRFYSYGDAMLILP